MNVLSETAVPDDQGVVLEPAVRLVDASVALGGREILHSLTMELEPGIVALVGANGSGKSTLLKAIATLVPVSAGSITVRGLGTRGRREAAAYRRMIGYLPQEPSFPQDFTVLEALRYAAWLRGVPAGDRAGRVSEMVERLDLAAVASSRLGTLSGGTRQRAYIGQAVIHRPLVVLLDEPTTGVDTVHRVELRDLLRDLAADRLLVMSTHLTEDIELLATRVVAMREGTVEFDGSPQALAALADDAPEDSARRIELGLRALGGKA